jgi:lysophospholipase L1-like esterase
MLSKTRRRIGYTLVATIGIVAFLVGAFAIVGEGLVRRYLERAQDLSDVDFCDRLVIACIGDSLTYGPPFRRSGSYPAHLVSTLEAAVPGLPVETVNLAVPGANTSQQLSVLEKSFEQTPEFSADFAIILTGINNYWNFRHATFWDRPGSTEENAASNAAADLLGLHELHQRDPAAFIDKVRVASYSKLRDRVGEEALRKRLPTEFFGTWLENDLARMVDHLRRRGVEPVLATYHFMGGDLNQQLRAIAENKGLKLVELELPLTFYEERGYLTDGFHMNSAGYLELAQRIAERLTGLYSKQELQERLHAKKQSAHCAE